MLYQEFRPEEPDYVTAGVCLAGIGLYYLRGKLVDRREKQHARRESIHACAYQGDLHSLRDHLETVDMESRNYFGCTPFLSAAEGDHLEIVKYLGSYYADPTVRSNCGYTALIFAAEHGNLAMAKYLIEECRVDINEATNKGKTALVKAAQKAARSAFSRKHQEVVFYLLSKGAEYDSILSSPQSEKTEQMKKIIRDSLELLEKQQKVEQGKVREVLKSEEIDMPDVLAKISAEYTVDLPEELEKPSCMTKFRQRIGF